MKAELNVLKLSDKELEIATGGKKMITVTGDGPNISTIVGQDMIENSVIISGGNDLISPTGGDDYISITGENHFPNIS